MRSAVIFGVVLALVFGRDALNAVQQQQQSAGKDAAADARAPPPPLDVDGGRSANLGVHISFCTSWSYKGAFMQVKQHLERAVPGIHVVGTTYPLTPARAAAARAAGAAQMAGLAFVFFGDRLFAAAGFPAPPAWYEERIRANKGTAALGVWLVGNMAVGSLSASGAFEIYFNGELAFSKLAAGRLPDAAEFDALVARIYAAHAAAAEEGAAAAGAAAAGAAAAGSALA